jgi:hypothetical protein
MYLEVEPNANTGKSVSMIYRDITPPREVFCVKHRITGGEQVVQVTGWDAATDRPCSAYACKIEESGDGMALLIYGGSGGIRMKELEDPAPWNSHAHNQWGETHLVHPLDAFIVYKDEIG